MRLADYAATYKSIVDAILNSGPLVQENLDDLRVICDAACRIRERTIAQFGLSAAPALTDEELQQLLQQPTVKAANEALGKAAGVSGVKGPFVDMLMQLIQLAMQNPQLLALILSLFSKTQPTVPA